MSSSIIEILRSANEEVEGLEKACALAFHYKDDHPREAVIAERIVKVALDRIQTKSREILELYADYDLRRKHENEIFSGQRFVSEEHRNEVQRQTGISNVLPDVWDNFGEKCRETEDFVSRYCKVDEIAPQLNFEANLVFQRLLEEQTKECERIFPHNDEKKGRYVDLQKHFFEYQNLKMKKGEKPYADDYISYIENFERFDEVAIDAKRNNYKEYLEHLEKYLLEFLINSKPLADHSKLQEDMDAKFESDWEKGEIPGWEEEIRKVRAEQVSEESKTLFCAPCK